MSPNDRLAASRAAFDRARQSMPGGNTRSSVFEKPFPLYLARGRGAYVLDLDGRRYLDFQNNFTALIHGYGHPDTTAALAEQIDRGLSFANPTGSEIELAELLCARVPFFEHLRFTNTGSEAVMMAIKAARALTGRVKIAKCEGAYHGNYDPVEVSFDSTPENWGGEVPRSVPYNRGTPNSVLDEVVVLPFNDIEQSERILSGCSSDLAAILIDPLPSRLGLFPVARPYLSFLRNHASRHGTLLISDEVLSFRLSFKGAIDELGIEPDLCAFGKIIGGGLPIGAIAGRRETMAVFDPSRGKPAVSHAGTFTANPLSMVAGLAAMRAMTPQEFVRINSLGEYARKRIGETFREAGIAGRVTGAGSLFRIFLGDRAVTSYRTAYASAEEKRRLAALIRALRDEGILLSSVGLGALSTPMRRAEIDHFADTLRRCLACGDADGAALMEAAGGRAP